MKTIIKTVHNEEYSDGSRTLGVLYNYSNDGDWSDSFIFIYKKGMYIFFSTIIDMADYLLYSDPKTKRAYMEEKEFDEYYDADYIDGKFTDILKWQ